MRDEALHRFEREGKRFVIDPATCFCFECDAISWDVLDYYPHTPANRILHLLGDRHPVAELKEVIGELEWLRATKSILPALSLKDLPKAYEVERGLKRVFVAWPSGGAVADTAAALLLARSAGQQQLHFEAVAQKELPEPERLAAVFERALRAAALAGKSLTAAVRVDALSLARAPKALSGHRLALVLESQTLDAVASAMAAVREAGTTRLERLAKVLQTGDAGGRIVLRPGHPHFAGAVTALDDAGFHTIEIDLNGAYIRQPGLDPAAMVKGLGEAAVYYAERLRRQHYFRLEPMASLFKRIYEGTPLPRSDPAGTNELAVAHAGKIYPSWHLVGVASLCLGSTAEGVFDEEAAGRFEDAGAMTTPVCMRCWARNLCGGGPLGVHHALTGSYRQPHEAWCDAQREWMGTAVAAFNRLSSEGVNFTRLHSHLGPRRKTPLFALARAALRVSIGMRAIEEGDAELLTQWENWNEAAYFLCNESGLFLATRYDREMDSLHPRGIEQEFMLVRKDGTPFGLFKIRPERLPGTATAWVYLHDPADYAAPGVRKSFRFLLREAGQQQALRRLAVPAGPSESGLAAFLMAVGFERQGVLREALYLHGTYHDVTVFEAALDRH